MTEMEQLIDELVAKGGSTTGQIKLNQDPVKVARLLELGWKEPEPMMSPVGILQQKVKVLEKAMADHEKRITENSVRR